MATFYITDEAKQNLDILVNLEKRPIGKEIEFLVERRLRELKIPIVNPAEASLPGNNSELQTAS